MPTIADILTFISTINTTIERFTARNFFICRYFIFYEQLKFCVHLLLFSLLCVGLVFGTWFVVQLLVSSFAIISLEKRELVALL